MQMYCSLRALRVMEDFSPTFLKLTEKHLSPLISPHKLGFFDYVSLYRPFERFLPRAFLKPGHFVERVELEKVPVRTRRRAGPPVAFAPEVVCALGAGRLLAALHPVGAGGHVPHEPVDERPPRGVGVVHYESEGFRPFGDPRYIKLRRNIPAVAGHLPRNHSPFLEIGAR